MPSSQKPTSSKKVHRGSVKSASSHRSFHPSPKSYASERPIDRYLDAERDYKSYAVVEYDPYQDAAKAAHEKQLRDVLEMDYEPVEHYSG